MNPVNPYAGITAPETRSNTNKAVTESTTSATGTTSKPASANAVAQDHVTLSPQARSLMAAQNSATDSSAQVAHIKAALANGTYQISPQKIGQGLTQDNQQFLPLTTSKSA